MRTNRLARRLPRHWSSLRLLAFCTVFVGAPVRAGDETDRKGLVDFKKEVLPLLAAKCIGCHGEKKKESGLDLRTEASILEGGDSGPAFVPGDPEESLLIQRVRDGEMPPKKPDRLTAEQISLLTRWVDSGGFAKRTQGVGAPETGANEGGKWWSFRRPTHPQVPGEGAGNSEGRTRNPIDAFVRARLEKEGLQPAPLAGRRTLARRAYFDLLGLPPTPEQVDAFVNDPSPDAYEKLIEDLLRSPHYGERWGRHWLDVARYADTGGYETDITYKNAWRYRDYVVKSFNDDKPYDRFVQEQVAGDELWPDNLDLDGSYVMPPQKLRHLEARTGTGFYALGPQIHESNMDARKLTYERLIDWVDTTGAAFLGLTIACARCHDHKFDPITQRDYYALQAAFAGSKEVDVPIVNAMEIADHKQHYPKVLAVDEARRAYRLFERNLAGRAPTPEEQKKRRQLLEAIAQAVLALPEKAASTPSSQFDGIMEIPSVTVLGHERPELVPAVHLLNRGDLGRAKERVQAGLPEFLARLTGRQAALPGPFGSRRELALWLTKPDHPLTSRVMVNRIWAWHFGRGLVATPNDFGKMGQAPSHPELLDWLATEFVARGWSIKEMHRLIMRSDTYRRSSSFFTDRHGQLDPDNRLLWRMNRRRLEAESLWDAIHAVAGTLNLKAGGRPVMPPLAAEELTNKAEWVVSADPAEHTRRGLYIFVRRNFRFPLFELFDAPVNAFSCAGRDISTVAPQALWSLNNKTSLEQSRHFAARLVREAGRSAEAWTARAWRLALGRAPTEDETREALALLSALEAEVDGAGPRKDAPEGLASLPPERAAALVKLCLTLFNLNEFIYID